MRHLSQVLAPVACALLGFSSAGTADELPLIHTMDTLDQLMPGEGSEIYVTQDPVFEGAGAVALEWDDATHERGFFDWILPEDPDASNWQIQFNVWPPSFITEISLELIDLDGQVAEGWFWDVRDSWDNRYNTLTAIVGDQSGADRHNVGPGNITQVERVRFDERSGNGGWSWNYWDYVIITPEPTSALLLLSGFAVIGRLRRAN